MTGSTSRKDCAICPAPKVCKACCDFPMVWFIAKVGPKQIKTIILKGSGETGRGTLGSQQIKPSTRPLPPPGYGSACLSDLSQGRRQQILLIDSCHLSAPSPCAGGKFSPLITSHLSIREQNRRTKKLNTNTYTLKINEQLCFFLYFRVFVA